MPGHPVADLTAALMRLPGLGERSARRMVRHLLERDRATLAVLAQALQQAQAGTQMCERCRRWSSSAVCAGCEADSSQSPAPTLLVVEHEWMLDWWARARPDESLPTAFVLHGQLSPLDRVQPDDIGLPQLDRLVLELKPQRVIVVLVEQVTGHLTAQAIAARLKALDAQTAPGIDLLWLARDDEAALITALASRSI